MKKGSHQFGLASLELKTALTASPATFQDHRASGFRTSFNICKTIQRSAGLIGRSMGATATGCSTKSTTLLRQARKKCRCWHGFRSRVNKETPICYRDEDWEPGAGPYRLLDLAAWA